MNNIKTKIMKNCKFLTILAILGGLIVMSFKPIDKKVIVIDAGHGGMDNGAQYNNFAEKQIVLNISEQIKKLNKNSDLEIILLRPDDKAISLTDRAAKINAINPDLVLSLHLNKSTNVDSSGIEAFVSEKNTFYDKSKNLAESFLNKLNFKELQNNGVKTKDLHILRTSNCPAILLEIGYLSNTNDRNFITSTLGQKEIAEKILNAIKD